MIDDIPLPNAEQHQRIGMYVFIPSIYPGDEILIPETVSQPYGPAIVVSTLRDAYFVFLFAVDIALVPVEIG